MYAAVRQGKAKPGMADEIVKLAKKGAVPVIAGIRGFRDYYIIAGDDDLVTTVSVFASKAGAEKCNALMADWIRANLAPLLVSEGPVSAIAGQVKLRKSA